MAPFLYCGGYRAMIASARLLFCAVNSNGIEGLFSGEFL